ERTGQIGQIRGMAHPRGSGGPRPECHSPQIPVARGVVRLTLILRIEVFTAPRLLCSSCITTGVPVWRFRLPHSLSSFRRRPESIVQYGTLMLRCFEPGLRRGDEIGAPPPTQSPPLRATSGSAPIHV